MKKRLAMALAAGALVVAMMPGVASADQPLVSAIGACTTRDGVPKLYNAVGPVGSTMSTVRRWMAADDCVGRRTIVLVDLG